MSDYDVIHPNLEWEDCCLSFKCSCGETIYLDTQNGHEICSCGLEYDLYREIRRYGISHGDQFWKDGEKNA